MKYIVFAMLLLLLSGCGGGHQAEPVTNPYVDRVQTLHASGVAMLQRERWISAEKTFGRALVAAQLADDSALIARSWYNLGVVRAARGNRQEAEEAFMQAMTIAERHGHRVSHMRARLGLAMSRSRAGEGAWTPSALEGKWPADVHLAAARLAQYQGRNDVAGEEYRRAAARSDRKTRAGLTYRAQAHMGLAMLAHAAGNDEAARKETEQVLQLCRQAGAPRLAAHALLLFSELGGDAAARRDSLERAWSIYRALKDDRGQRESLEALIALARDAGEHEQAARWQRQLGRLPAANAPEVAPLPSPATGHP